MKKNCKRIVLYGFVISALTGCAGLSELEITEYLNSIPVEMPDLSLIVDGVYEGDYSIALPPGGTAVFRDFKVFVKVAVSELQEITIIEPRMLSEDDDFKKLGERILESNELTVDGVSGASYSSKAFVKAIEIALTEALER